MESRRKRRMRKKARMRALGNSLLVVALAAACLTLVKYAFSLGAPDAAVIDRIAAPAHAAGPDAASDGCGVLVLVNRDNRLPEGFRADLADFEGAKVGKALVGDLAEMRAAAAGDGVYLGIGSAYRSAAEQEAVFNEAVSGFAAQGDTRDVAIGKAGRIAALPGHSEHETGLAIDFSLDGDMGKQAEMWDWLGGNAWEYGFILRYPEGKERITGCSYEPWHYRYVGKADAKAVYRQGLALEEYLGAGAVSPPPPGAPGAPGSMGLPSS